MSRMDLDRLRTLFEVGAVLGATAAPAALKDGWILLIDTVNGTEVLQTSRKEERVFKSLDGLFNTACTAGLQTITVTKNL